MSLSMIPFQPVHKAVNFSHFGRDINALRTMWGTLVTSNTVIGLTEFWNGAIIADQEFPACLDIFFVTCVGDIFFFVNTFVVMDEY